MTRSITDCRDDFPILKTQVNGKPLVYLDNGATTQKPQCVIDAITHYYTHDNSNIHRGNHALSVRASEAHEAARETVRQYINAASLAEIIFTRGTTESINLVAYCFGEAFINPGDEIIVSEMDHHSNFVPWQLLCERKGAIFKVIPFDENGNLELETFKQLLSARTKLVSLNHVSNSLGTVNPVKEIIRLAHEAGAAVMIDAAQSVQHIEHDVQDLDCDFYAFSGHKMYAPTGIGVLYGKQSWLEQMPPWQSGGEMIDIVTIEKSTFNHLPFKFEAGTPNIVGPIGLAAAIDYINQFSFNEIMAAEDDLLAYGTGQLEDILGIQLYGKAKRRSGILAFNVEGIQHYDMGVLLDTHGVAVRTGHHCTQPVMHRLGVGGTVRASLAMYNTREDVDRLVEGILKIKKMLRQ